MKLTVTLYLSDEGFERDPYGMCHIVAGILTRVPSKLHNQLQRRSECVCTALEEDDKLRDYTGNVIGTVRLGRGDKRDCYNDRDDKADDSTAESSETA